MSLVQRLGHTLITSTTSQAIMLHVIQLPQLRKQYKKACHQLDWTLCSPWLSRVGSPTLPLLSPGSLSYLLNTIFPPTVESLFLSCTIFSSIIQWFSTIRFWIYFQQCSFNFFIESLLLSPVDHCTQSTIAPSRYLAHAVSLTLAGSWIN